MNLSYKSKKLETLLTTDKGIAKNYGILAKKVKQRMNKLRSAANLLEISKLPALRLHPHKGRGKGIWSIDIQKNWRILFTISQDPTPKLKDGSVDLGAITMIKIMSVSDPH